MKITKHFNSTEFDCRDGHKYPLNWCWPKLHPLCEALEIIRAITGKTMTINSGYRTEIYNRKVGGSKNSQHIQGMAADFKLKGISPKRLFPILDRLQKLGVIPRGGLHAYSTFTHLDIEGYRLRRWK